MTNLDNDSYRYRHGEHLIRPQHIRVEGRGPSIFRAILRPYEYERQMNDANIQTWQKALETLEQDLGKKGMLGTHDLLSLDMLPPGVWGDIQGQWELKGSLFLLFGSVEGHGAVKGNVRTVSAVRFAWSPDEDQVVLTEIPVDKVRFHRREIEAPNALFTFDQGQLIHGSDSSDLVSGTIVYNVDSFANPNDYMRDDRLVIADIAIPPQTDIPLLPRSLQ